MNVWILLSLLALSLMASATKKDPVIQTLEQSMMNKLHKPWFTPEKPPEFPRKGEYKCKGGICKQKPHKECDDCQQPVPLDFENK